MCCSKGNQLHVDLNATFEVGTVLDIPKIVELFQGHLIDTYWLPDPEGNKLYKLDFTNTTIAGTTFFREFTVLYARSVSNAHYISNLIKISKLHYCTTPILNMLNKV